MDMKQIERKLQSISGSLFVSLPRSWVNQYKLDKGSKVDMELAKDGRIILAPSLHREKQVWKSTINYDQTFYRRFFRDYLKGNDFITILFKKKLSPKERKNIFDFLDKLMNVHVVEETSEKLVLQSFKLAELSVKQCLKRMFFLTKNMFDELIESNDSSKINEIDVSVSKYYYILILQIRRFLEEGQFTHDSEVSIISSVDIRMISEKIERVGDIIKYLSSKKMKRELKPLAQLVFDKYVKAVNSYFTKNFEKAASLWQDEVEVRNEFRKARKQYVKEKSIENIENLNQLFNIFKFGKEIANIVR